MSVQRARDSPSGSVVRFSRPETSETKNLKSVRMPCRTYDLLVKVQPWELLVHPCSEREVQGVTRSTKFPDNGSFSGPSKPAGCSESGPIGSLVIIKEAADPLDVRGRLIHLLCTITRVGNKWTSGVAGVTRRGSHHPEGTRVARETLMRCR
jgi:hypothetical protein